MSVSSRIALTTNPARQYLARSSTSRSSSWRTATPTASSLISQQQRFFTHQQPSRQATHSDDPSYPPNTTTKSNDAQLSSQFDPPRQISKILTHYCREPQLVMIEGYGVLQGEMDQSRVLTKYLNVPFAKVQNRFQEAVAPEPWKGIRDATLYGPMCPQNTQETNNLSTLMLGLPGPGFEYSEHDCLNLNVFAPRCIVGHVPVICYIHGGLSQGGIALPKHDATNIVKKSVARGLPVIVVTINYRLIPSAGLLKGAEEKHGVKDGKQSKDGNSEEDNASFNWGLYDQKIALEWVRKNIHNFGGNPNEITLMGHSNGASSAGYHMLTTATTGQQGEDGKKRLFKRAIMHSGARQGSLQHMENTHRLDSLLGDMVPIGSSSPSSSTSLSATVAVSSVPEQENKDSQQQSTFTFMSDACLPFMDEKEKQAGWRVIDKWIDFAWGQESDAASDGVRS
ncbi:Carboxylesterase family-domain-containing protein [Linnemannia elongata]|nr:Carboxylesterase family-domain-containing protein [Linnemannia elongata]